MAAATPARFDRKRLNEHNGKTVGRGFCSVVRAAVMDGSVPVAVKDFDFKNSKTGTWNFDQFDREVRVFGACGAHPNIVRYFGSSLDKAKGTAFIVLELGDADALSQRKDDAEAVSEDNTLSAFWIRAALDATRGLRYLHEAGFYHRDFTLANWLFFRDKTTGAVTTKITDFGGALHQADEPVWMCGHQRLSAPEVVAQRGRKELIQYTFAADVYMLGTCLFEILDGPRPEKDRFFARSSVAEVGARLERGERPALPDADPAFADLITRCWAQDPGARPSLAEVEAALEAMLAVRTPDAAGSVKDPTVPAPRAAALDPTGDIAGEGGEDETHTVNLYSFDEVMSTMQKAIRRGLVDDAMYWCAELDRSGRGRVAMNRLCVVASEDLSLGTVSLPVYMLDQFRSYCAADDAARTAAAPSAGGAPEPGRGRGRGSRGGGRGRGRGSGPTPEQRRESRDKARAILMSTAATLASTPKCRVTNNACCVSMRYIEDRYDDPECYSEVTPALVDRLRDAMDAYRANPKEREEDVLFLLQRIHMERKWDNNLWKMLLALKPTSSVIADNIHALHAIKGVGGEGGLRLRLFHSCLLYTREAFLTIPGLVTPLTIPAARVAEVYSMGRHAVGIPLYAVDRHNARGKGGGSDPSRHFGVDTSGDLIAAARRRGVDISVWTDEEKAKSHGPGRIWPKNRRFLKGPEDNTLISQFFREGAACDVEVFPANADRDPYFDDAFEYYLDVEERYGSTEAKSTRIIAEQLRELAKRRSAGPKAAAAAPAKGAAFLPTDVDFPALGSGTTAPRTAAPLAPTQKGSRRSRVQGGWT